jgi:NAD(P)-dependent dehydrogenase (short-subunit alcohol dehydrogenase family)
MTDKRSVFITGASSGFGKDTAIGLAEKGHTVFATMRGVDGKNEEVARELKGLAEEHGWHLHVLDLDVTDDVSVATAVEAAMETAGHLDVVINDAGVGTFGPAEAYPVEQMQAVFDVNVFGVHRVNRAILPHMRARGEGHIIYVSSGLGRFVFPFVGPYAATKFALGALAETSHYELRREGIDTTIVQPGAYATDFGAKMIGPREPEILGGYQAGQGMFEAIGQLFAERAQAGHFGDPREVVDAMVSLAEAPKDRRPLRVPVGADGAAAVNEVSSQVQAGVLEWMEIS